MQPNIAERTQTWAVVVEGIVKKHKGSRGSLISILQDIQSEYNYLPAEALKELADETNRSLVDIYGVATFYKSFSLAPRGQHIVSVCLGTACHVRGAVGISEEFERQLKVKAGQTTSDKKFTLETVNCLGACALGPIVVADGHYFSNVESARIKGIVKKVRAGLDGAKTKGDKRVFPVEVSCASCNHSLMDPNQLIDDHPSVRLTMSFGTKHGWFRLSALYGSYAVEPEHKIPKNTVVNFFCPHCHAEMVGASKCPECGTRMIPMIVSGGGVLQICTKHGCKGQMLDLSSTFEPQA